MAVQLLIGPPASGKTGTCIQHIQQLQAHHPIANIWVILPDYQNIAYFRKRLARAGGGVGVNVGTFRVLYQEILEKTGNYAPVISPSLEHRLVKETVEPAFAAGALTHYGEIRSKPGFNLALQDIFSELRSAYISPERFLAYTQSGTQAKRELAQLYEGFLSRLQNLNWIDRNGQVWQAIKAIQEHADLLSDIDLLIVDGFSAFAGARVEFLKSLSPRIGKMILTLPGALNSGRQVDRRTQSEIERLIQALSPQIDEIKSDPHLPPASRHLAAHVLDPGDFEKQPSANPLLLEASSQSEEAREALRWIKSLNIRQGVPLHDCAIFVGNFVTYRPLLRAAAGEFGIKIHFSHPDSLVDSPAIQSVLNLLQLPLADFQTRLLFNTLHSPYFDFGLTDQEVDHLELVSHHFHIVMGSDQWEEAWSTLSQMENNEDLEDEDRGFRNPLKDIDLVNLRNQFAPFWQIFAPIVHTRSLEEWITWLESTLDGIHFYDQIIEEREQEACASLGEALKALILSEQVAGVRSVDYTAFLADLQGALQSARLDVPKEGRRNALLIGKITDARATRYKAVVLMGFSEGIFPMVENPDPFLDEGLRHDLGLDPQLAREQSSIFYEAFTRADQSLLLTRPYLAEDGEKWEPSPYWEASTKLFEKSAVEKISKNLLRSQSEAASSQELLFWAVRQGKMKYPLDAELAAHWQELQSASRILSHRRSKRASGPFEGFPVQLAQDLQEKYSPNSPMSASRLETYATCPFYFYVQQVLGLEPKEPPELGLDARQVGSMLHRILELVYAHAGEDADLEQLLASLLEYANQVFKIAPQKFGFRPSPLWKVEQTQFLEMLTTTIEALEVSSQDWTPISTEAKFGIADTPPLVIDLGETSITLRGLIDRVDRNSSGELRVIDYKTGGSHLSKPDFDQGRRLQLPIYGLAAQKALDLGEVVEGFYWAIKDAKASSIKLSGCKTENAEGFEAALEVMTGHLIRILSGIHSGNFPPQPPRGGCPNFCPAARWCWRYQPSYF